MNLLYKHISNIPNYEILKCIFIVDDNVYYVATVDKDNDMIIHKNLPHIIEQSAHFEEDLRIVKYKTYRKESKTSIKPKEIITRDVHNRFKKLF